MKKKYIIYHGKYYTEGIPVAVFDTKSDAKEQIEGLGYKYDKVEKMFLNDSLGRWYRIDVIQYNTL